MSYCGFVRNQGATLTGVQLLLPLSMPRDR
jgi:hypothetical protein